MLVLVWSVALAIMYSYKRFVQRCAGCRSGAGASNVRLHCLHLYRWRVSIIVTGLPLCGISLYWRCRVPYSWYLSAPHWTQRIVLGGISVALIVIVSADSVMPVIRIDLYLIMGDLSIIKAGLLRRGSGWLKTYVFSFLWCCRPASRIP